MIETFSDWYGRSRLQAQAHQIPLAELDWLIIGITKISRLDLKLNQINLPTAKIQELDRLWQQRVQHHRPIQYLLGFCYWHNLELKVSSAVLIPRPETELIIEIAQTFSNNHPREIWLDLGTGSGAIAIAIALSLTAVQVYGVDISTSALAIAKENAQKYRLSERIQFYQGSWFEPLTHLKNQVTAMVANPPYIPRRTLCQLEPEVYTHEPHLALDGGLDGLECLRHLIVTAPTYLISGGYWLVEVMADQAQAVVTLLEQNGQYTNIQIHPDYDGINRFVSCCLK